VKFSDIIKYNINFYYLFLNNFVMRILVRWLLRHFLVIADDQDNKSVSIINRHQSKD